MTGIIMATALEAKPFITHLTKDLVDQKPFRVYRGGGLLLAISGIGKVNAGVAVSYLTLRHGISRVVNIGAAGAVGEGPSLGDMFHVDRIVESDRPLIPGMGIRVNIPDIIPGFPAVTLATRDIPVIDSGERKEAARYCDLVDMEGAAVLQSARLMGLGCYIFKCVSDTPSDQSDRAIVENIRAIRERMFGFFSGRVLQSLPDL